ncbi:MAG TPA: methyltransferase domain-containing protein, partial [Candidatus Poseidoniales archaeon]|nr:methyltransferase domain-containing protein [Candidatus Poseidoniales archaeon]
MIPATASRPLQRKTPFEQVAARLPHWMRPHLPRKWVQLGRVLLLRLPHVLEDERQPVAAAYATLPGVEAVMRRPRIGGELRQPQPSQLLLGSSAETEVREHGLCYRLDLQRVMWAPGNVGWRAGPRGPAAVAALYAHPGPRAVLDCFAGVGYFALQFARHWPAAQVIAVEKNPIAVEYLRQNVALNELANVEVIESDCRDVTREADIVHLGYIGDSARFLPYAASQLRD